MSFFSWNHTELQYGYKYSSFASILFLFQIVKSVLMFSFDIDQKDA